MTAVFRVGLIRLCSRNAAPVVPAAVNQQRFISGKTMRGGPRVITHKPFPYKEKEYGVFQSMLDKTTKRLHENSKIICVEGPIAAGKSKFAKELAEELEMLYVPEANMDMVYINSYGYDMRKLDPQLPESCRSYDVVNFCKEPNHSLAATFQIRMYMLRFEQYVDSLAHLLSTGQGVVLDRSCFSDFVFLESMYRQGYISKGARSVYHELRQNTINELLRPHLVIYLDLPVDAVKQRIKARNIDYEVNSKVFNDAYLRDMENIYKQQYLKDIASHAELLIYDWTAGGETEVVVEDIERIDFDRFDEDPLEKKMKDWRFPNEGEWCETRIKYCSGKPDLMNYFNVPRFDVPELMRDADSGKKWRDVWFNAPGMKYRPGFNEDMGDSGLLTKTKTSFVHNTV
ncbi:NADH dehydrogenase [ubiquinone] 1 alpha subcomplex subunit 10, mitochondrial [Lucilia cuprina]|uniref:NADH dehydrogenase [ubiquinone] 1 alpha subcomplex subunit 10, mitochondrial n=1 Tax=Lucilia cuprina TaxID=7375 RepID=A0A0L0C5X1_LUCCU|nr:mitochondrial, NADH dehydrogenase [ubiquinone] 1 alpha subcomplex subunit 10 [Lucilia cuprina]KNC26814.1 NADH dehydrogenase [ubiquinone] 1 alpha subcomplex subunit 10, mitochondrial [Lucilia cuprina]